VLSTDIAGTEAFRVGPLKTTCVFFIAGVLIAFSTFFWPSSAFKFARIRLVTVPFTTIDGAELLRIRLALNSLFRFCSSSSRFNRSSRCALSRLDIASPGNSKSGCVSGLDDLDGVNPGFEVL
jgi:hypothetical protein